MFIDEFNRFPVWPAAPGIGSRVDGKMPVTAFRTAPMAVEPERMSRHGGMSNALLGGVLNAPVEITFSGYGGMEWSEERVLPRPSWSAAYVQSSAFIEESRELARRSYERFTESISFNIDLSLSELIMKEDIPSPKKFSDEIVRQQRADFVALLRSPENWPESFTWDYAKPRCCAMGLLHLVYGNELMSVGVHSRFVGMSYMDAYKVFGCLGTEMGDNWKVTPEIVADRIEAAPFVN